MKRRLTVLASAFVLLLAVSGANGMVQVDGAAEPGPETGSVVLLTENGTVVSSTATSLVIRTEGGQEKAFVVDAYSDIPPTLSVGARVTVESQALADGRYQLTKVTTGATGTGSGMETTPMSDDPSTSAQELPGTASPLLLMGLAGLVAIGGGLGLRRAFRGNTQDQDERDE
jgi:hypothetical protein